MKNILLATTALVMTAGMASAEVTFSGDARLGYKNVESSVVGDDVQYRTRIKASASGTADNGMTYSVALRFRDTNQTGDVQSNSVTVGGAFGSLSVGSESSAAEYAVGDLAAVGWANAANESAFTAGAEAIYAYSAGDLSIYGSVGAPGTEITSAGVSYSMNGINVAVATEDTSAIRTTWAAVSTSMLGATVKVIASDSDVGSTSTAVDTSVGGSVAYTSGAVTLSGLYKTTTTGADVTTTKSGGGVSYAMGGGMTLVAGTTTSSKITTNSIGINLSF